MASIEFSKSEFEYGKVAFLGIHSGYLASIIPVGFGLILLRFCTGIFLLFSSVKFGENTEYKDQNIDQIETPQDGDLN